MITIKKSDLNLLDMNNGNDAVHLTEMHQYYVSPAGSEHYRLLYQLAKSVNGKTFLDIGTYKGSSALALSNNKTNMVYSYNIINQLDCEFHDISNIVFVIKDVLLEPSEVLLNADCIVYDIAPHNGTDEFGFYEYMKMIGYGGIAIFDDIHLNPSMDNFWNKIDLQKIDLTELGHSSGTGAVFFGNERIIVE